MKIYGLVRRCNDEDIQYYWEGSFTFPHKKCDTLEKFDTKSWQVIRLDVEPLPRIRELQLAIRNMYKKIKQLEAENEEFRKITCTRCK